MSSLTLPAGQSLLSGLAVVRAALGSPEPIRADSDLPAEPGIEALRRRDPGSWRALFARETASIYRYVFARLGDPEDAEDVTSEVFEEAWRHIESLEDRQLPPRAWLFGLARNIVARRRRKLFRQPPVLAIEAFDGSGGDPGADAEILDLVRAVAELSQSHGEVITLRFIHGLSLQETAVALRTTVDSIKGRQARALGELRKRLRS